MSKQYTIGQKLFACFLGMVVVAGILGYAGLHTVSSMDKTITQLVNVSSKKLDLVGAMNAAEADMFVAQRGMILSAFVKDSAKVESERTAFLSKSAIAKKKLEEVRGLLSSDATERYTASLNGELDRWLAEFTNLTKLVREGRTDEAMTFAGERIVPIHEKFSSAAEEFGALLRLQMNEDVAASESRSASSTAIAWVLIVITLAVAGAGVQVVWGTNHTLRQITLELREGAEQIASASGQVSSTSQSLAQGASEQAASLEETSASTEELTSMTRKNAENSSAAASVMGQVDQKVGEANQTLGGMVTSMKEINASSDKIARIIKVIDEIAFQTNILALNAAVEAARAGEAGMGFAVVADEVRNLAQRCAQAAKDTAALIEESITKSNEGRKRLEQVTSAIGAITGSATEVKTLVDEVNLGSQEQARGIEQISKSINQMEQVTQKTAANAEESASASEEMSAQAQLLKALVDRLQVMVGAERQVEARTVSPGRRPTARVHVRPATSAAGRSLASLHHAVETRTVTQAHAAAVHEAFPLEDDFKEFRT